MSLNIKDAVYGLGEKLGVDMSNAPASNIADMVDYISNGVGAHTGVIAEAVDKLEVGGGGDTPDWLYIVDAAPIEEGSSTTRLNRTYAEISQQLVGPGTALLYPTHVGIIRWSDETGVGYYPIIGVGYDPQGDKYDVKTIFDMVFTAASDEDYPSIVMPTYG